MKNVNKAKHRAALIGSGRPVRQEEDLKPVQRRLQIALTIVLLLLVAPVLTAQTKQPQESGHFVLSTEISDKGLSSVESETTVRIGVLDKRGKEICRQKWGFIT